jgi:hypothetical protein
MNASEIDAIRQSVGVRGVIATRCRAGKNISRHAATEDRSFSARPGIQDDSKRRSILHRPPRIHEFSLTEDLATSQFGQSSQADKRGFPNMVFNPCVMYRLIRFDYPDRVDQPGVSSDGKLKTANLPLLMASVQSGGRFVYPATAFVSSPGNMQQARTIRPPCPRQYCNAIGLIGALYRFI